MARTAPERAQGSLREHDCVSVACTACGAIFDDEFTHHFASTLDALAAIEAANWVITAQSTLCPNCTDGPDPNAPVTVRLCEYCSPALFSATPPPGSCRCHDQAITHVLVPRSADNPRVQHHSCTSIHCSDCAADLGDEECTPHYPTAAAAIAAAKNADWMVVDGRVTTCPTCTKLRCCTALGHSWPEHPNFVSPAGLEYRYCQHDCGQRVTNLINDKDMPWL